MRVLLVQLVFLAAGAAADGEDFTNNLFSDLAPLLALFGENFARQFLSESFTWLDHIIFAMAPLGIITAIVGAIRVAGPSWLRAVIGRARENLALAELEFMSSTSHEVCELWNGEAIVRTMGKGKVKQIIYLEDFANEKNCGLFTLSEALDNYHCMREEKHQGPYIAGISSVIQALVELPTRTGLLGSKAKAELKFKRKNIHNGDSESRPVALNESKRAASSSSSDKLSPVTSSEGSQRLYKHCHPQRAPNISLNLHIEDKTRIIPQEAELLAVALIGIVLQSGVIVFAAFTAYNFQMSERVGGDVQGYAFPVLALGTGMLALGMIICSAVIEQSTEEYIWTRDYEGENNAAETVLPEQPLTDTSPQVTYNASREERTSTLHTGKQAQADVHISEPDSITGFDHDVSQKSTKGVEGPLRTHKSKTTLAKKSPGNIRIFWLQTSHTVSDQSFNSFMIFARGTREQILTSRRQDDIDPNERAKVVGTAVEADSTKPSQQTIQQSKSKWHSRGLKSVTVVGVITGLSGFVLQFEGFRGLSWVCSIAQLVAILVMTILRAYIRRGLLDRPRTEEVDKDYEMDWLALRVGFNKDYLKGVTQPKLAEQPCIECQKVHRWCPRCGENHVCERGGSAGRSSGRSNCKEPQWEIYSREHWLATPGTFKLDDQMSQTEPPIFSRKPTTFRSNDAEQKSAREDGEGTHRDIVDPQQVVKVRTRLAELTRWMGPACSHSISIAAAIDKVMNTFFANELWGDRRFVWSLDARIFTDCTSSADANATKKRVGEIQFVVEHVNKKWRASAKHLEAALSLWIYHFYKKSQALKEVQETSRGERDWLRPMESTVEMELFRVLGHSNSTLETDLRFWIGSDVSSVIEKRKYVDGRLMHQRHISLHQTGSQNIDLTKPTAANWEQSDSDMKAVNNPDTQLGGSDDHNLNTHLRRAGTASQQTKLQEVLSLGFCDLDDSSQKIKLVEPEARPDEVLGVQSYASLRHFLAQHIFSAFIWAVADKLQTSQFGKITVEQSARGPVNMETNPSLTIRSEKLHTLARDLEGTGLGTLDEINSILIPPLSIMNKLPNWHLAERMLEDAKDQERVHWESAAVAHIRLLNLVENLSCMDQFVYRLIPNVINFLMFSLHTSHPKGAEAYDTEYRSKRETLCKITALLGSGKFLKATSELGMLYQLQRRLSEYQSIISTALGKTESLEIDGLTRTLRDKFEYNALHEKFAQGIADEDTFEDLATGDVMIPDILGWVPLHYAILTCENRNIKTVVDKWPEGCNQKDLADRTPFHYAAMWADKETVELIMGKTTLVNRSKDGMLPWHHAAAAGNIGAMQVLLSCTGDKRQDVNVGDKWERSALHLAACEGKVEILKLLLDIKTTRKLEIDSRDQFGRTALHVAAANRNIEVVKLLSDAGADLEILDNKDRLALELAADTEKLLDEQRAEKDDNEKKVGGSKKVTLKKPTTNLKPLDGTRTPREADPIENEQAQKEAKEREEKRLLEKQNNEKVMEITRSLITYLRPAQFPTSKSAVTGPEHVQSSPGSAWESITPYWAAQNGYRTLLRLLMDEVVKNGAADDECDDTGRNVLHYASDGGHRYIVKDILERWQLTAPGRPSDKESKTLKPKSKDPQSKHSVDLSQTPKDGQSLPSGNTSRAPEGSARAAIAGVDGNDSTKSQEQSQKSRKQIDQKDGRDKTPLLLAAAGGHSAVVEILLDAGASMKTRDEDDRLPISWAAGNGHVKALELFIDSGADINEPSGKFDATPLMFAADEGFVKCTKLLLDRGAKIDLQDKDGWTALFWSMNESSPSPNSREMRDDDDMSNTLEVTRLLLHWGVPKNAKDKDDETALMWAARRACFDLVKLLVAEKVEVNTIAHSKWNALTYAAMDGESEEIVDFLLENHSSVASDNDPTIIWAARNQHHDIISRLLTVGANVNAVDEDGETPLMIAAADGVLHTVKLLIKHRAKINAKNSKGISALAEAVDSGHQKVVEFLLANGADINTEDSVNDTPLMVAAANGDLTLTKFLIKHATVDKTNHAGCSALMQAVSNGYGPVAHCLLEKGAKVDLKDEDEQTPLMVAASKGNERMVDLLLTSRANIDEIDEDGSTALLLACEQGHRTVIEQLLSQGASPNIPNAKGETPLIMATRGNYREIVSLLLDNRAEPNFGEVLFTAINDDRTEIAKILLNKGADLEAKDSSDRSPLNLAVLNDNGELVRFLLRKHANTHSQDEDGDSPLHIAALMGRLQSARALLEAGSDINLTNKSGQTPLFLAIGDGNTDIIELLLKRTEIKIDLIDKWGSTPLSLAVLGGIESSSTIVLELLLDRGPDMELHAPNRTTVLQEAVNRGYLDVLRLLLDRGGADLHATDIHGRTYMHRAALSGSIDCWNELAARRGKNGEFLNAQSADKQGRSALIYAVMGTKPEMLEYLISECKFDANSHDKDEWTPLHWAARTGHEETINTLVKCGSRIVVHESLWNWTPIDVAKFFDEEETSDNLLSMARTAEENPSDAEGIIAGRNHHETCNSCLLNIVGQRFKCTECEFSFDLCQKCNHYYEAIHPPHKFKEIVDFDDDSGGSVDGEP